MACRRIIILFYLPMIVVNALRDDDVETAFDHRGISTTAAELDSNVTEVSAPCADIRRTLYTCTID